jgi:hypothetical protein
MSWKEVDVWEMPKEAPFYDTLVKESHVTVRDQIPLASDAVYQPRFLDSRERSFAEQLVVNMEVSR